MGLLTDGSIDARARQIIEDGLAGEPSTVDLRRAAAIFHHTSAEIYERAARWLRVDRALWSADLSPNEVLHAYARACVAYRMGSPTHNVLLGALSRADLDVVEAFADELLEDQSNTPGVREMRAMVVVPLARAGKLHERFERFLSSKMNHSDAMRLVLEAFDGERREAWLDTLLEKGGMFRAEVAISFMDFLTEAQRARLEEMVDELRSDDGEWVQQQVIARFDAGGGPPERGEDGLTAVGRKGLAGIMEKVAKKRIATGLGPLAEERWGDGIAIAAGELLTVDAWRATDDARRSAIGKELGLLLADRGVRFIGLETYDDLPIASYIHEPTGIALSLLPGGTVTRGFSPEEALVAEAAAAHQDEPNFYEEWQQLLDAAKTMRPLADVRVEPLLLARAPTEPLAPSETVASFELLPFRLPSEAEYEYASRGLVARALTWRGHEVPGEAWYVETVDGGARLANVFGLYGFGLYPEACADVWHESYEGAPLDASPRRGDGPRVLRGGAAMVYPWQACGEWQLLVNAMRYPAADTFPFSSVRPALGIRATSG